MFSYKWREKEKKLLFFTVVLRYPDLMPLCYLKHMTTIIIVFSSFDLLLVWFESLFDVKGFGYIFACI